MKKNAFSRVLALVLALIMVVGNAALLVVADETHEHVSTQATTHPEAEDHTLDNCPNAKKVGTTAPTCTEWGYSTYQCPDCECYFAADFVKPLGDGNHHWEVTKAATCTEKGSKKCTVCGTTADVEPAHTWANTGAATGNCKVCSVCGKTEGHEWNAPVILTQPTKETNGTAEYTCKNCGVKKTVSVSYADHLPEDVPGTVEAINASTCHKWTRVYKVDAKCHETGNIDYWYCAGCDTYLTYALNEKGEQVKNKAGETLVKVITKADTVIAALGHDFTPVYNADKTIKNLYNGTTVVGDFTNHKCTADLTCTRDCKDEKGNPVHKVVEVPHVNPTGINEKREPTCEKPGYESLVFCDYCGATEMINPKPATGHTSYEEALKKNIVTTVTEAKCNVAGEVSWKCQNKNCGKEIKKNIPALGQNIVTVTVPATCATYSYTYTYCKNANCDCTKYGDKEILRTYTPENVGKATVTLKNVVEGSFKLGAKSYDTNNHNSVKEQVLQDSTCTAVGSKFWYCTDCNASGTSVIPMKAHTTFADAQAHDKNAELVNKDGKWVIEDKASTCATEGKRVWHCNNCSTETYNPSETLAKLSHTWIDKVVAPTCQTKGYTLHVCKNCPATEQKDGKNVEYNVVPALAYAESYVFDSEDVAKKAHANLEYKEHYQEGSCTKLGLDKYFCNDCKNIVLVIVADTGKGHVEGEIIEEVVDATCTKPGSTAGYKCKYCGEYQAPVKVPALGHTGTCGEKCTRRGCGLICHDWKVTESRDISHLGLQKSFTLVKDGKETTVPVFNVAEFVPGYKHYTCNLCGEELIVDLDKDADHVITKKVTAADCTHEGTTVYTCSCGKWSMNGLSTPPNNTHHNKAGEAFFDNCVSTVKDRECVDCHGEFKDSANQHNYQAVQEIKANCKNPSYTFSKCLDCGKELTEIGEKLGDHVYTNKTTAATYHAVGTKTCDLCGHTEKIDDILKGIGFFLDVDNGTVAGASITDASLVAVTVKLDANNVALWGYKFDMNYDPSILTFVEAKFPENALNGKTAANDKLDDKKNSTGTVTIAANGALSNTVISEETAVVVVYFRVNNPADEKTETTVWLDKLEAVEFTAKGSKDVADLATKNAVVKIKKLLDLDSNGKSDGYFNLHDVLALYAILVGESDVDYAAEFDVDRDGVITLADYELVYKYLVGEVDYDVLVDRVVVEPEQPATPETKA